MATTIDTVPSGTDPDGDLIAQMATGDASALASLMDRHMTHIHQLAAHMLRDPVLAEDVTQSVFLKTWQTAPKWTPGKAKILTWMRRVATNQCLDILRKKSPVFTDNLPERVADGPNALDAVEHQQQSLHITDALKTLPDRQRLALTLTYYQDVSQKEGAHILGISISAYESLLVRARKSLKARLGSQDDFTMNLGAQS